MPSRTNCWLVIPLFLLFCPVGAEAGAAVHSEQRADGTLEFTNRGAASPAPQPEGGAAATAVPRLAEQRPLLPEPALPGNAVIVPYELYGNQMLIWGTVNRRTGVRLIVNTGASSSVLSAGILASAGVDRSAFRGPVVGFGVSGGYLTNYTLVDYLAVGPLELEKQEVAISVFDFPGADGLLGQEFLANFHLAIDPQMKQLVFTPLAGNESSYGGKPGTWWCRQFERLGSMAALWRSLRVVLPQFQEQLDDMIARIEDQLADLWSEAARAAVPLEHRRPPCGPPPER